MSAPSPLTSLSLAILLALADEERHGYGIIKEVERQTEGEVRIGTGSLYAALQRLSEDGLIEDSDRAPDPEGDQRRRYVRLTARGREVARAEALRIARVLVVAREKQLVPELSVSFDVGGA
jgi:DNA-binding PadR family transcriptional regulator